MSQPTFTNDAEALKAFETKYKALTQEIGKVIVGQDDVIKNVLIAVFSKGH
ncbi:MAG TPA: AAA family ATPase, partial [Flavobacteriales bacterium]|nr:AAA family ATPase [Flavobacteriales bacterium]